MHSLKEKCISGVCFGALVDWFWGGVAFHAFGVGYGLNCPGRLARGRHGST